MTVRVTVRRGPKIEHETWDSLEGAVAAAGGQAQGAAGRKTVDLVGRVYAPGEQVAARIELKHDRRRAGIDVRGDGVVVAWKGRVMRSPLSGDDPYEALKAA